MGGALISPAARDRTILSVLRLSMTVALAGLVLLVLSSSAFAAPPVIVTPSTLYGSPTASPSPSQGVYNYIAIADQVPDKSLPPNPSTNYDASASPGVWTSNAGPISSYQFAWYVCNSQGASCAPYSGATSGIFTMPGHVEAFTLRVKVSACNSDGCAHYWLLSEVGYIPTANLSPPTISGVAESGQSLSLNSPGSWEGTGNNCVFDPSINDTVCNGPALTYKWQRCSADGSSCADISGQSYTAVPDPYVDPTYALTSSDTGHRLRAMVKAVGSFGAGTVETASSTSSIVAGSPVNTGLPALSLPPGQLDTGDTLTASSGSWDGYPAPSFTYQWQKCDSSGQSCSDISGQTSSSLALSSGLVSSTVRVKVTASNAYGNTVAYSLDSGVIEGSPVNSSPPSLSGQVAVGLILSSSDGSWSASPAPSFTYQWLRCNIDGSGCQVISGATGSAYQVDAADRGHSLKSRVTAANLYGQASEDSAASSGVPGPPANYAAPTLSGQTRVGQALSASAGSWNGFPAPVITYQWLRCLADGSSCEAISGATSASYTLQSLDLGYSLRVRVDAQNSEGSESAQSANSAEIAQAAFAPVNSTAPSFTGQAQVGEMLSGAEGAWDGDPLPSLTYQWLRCLADGSSCSPIAGATSLNYTLTPADEGLSVRLRVDAQNSEGSQSADSLPSGVVDPIDSLPVNTALPEISGASYNVGGSLSASTGSWGGFPAPTFSYQWLRCDALGDNCSLIAGETASLYSMVSADAGLTLRVRVSASNSSGSASVDSDPTGLIGAAPSVLAAPSLSGVARQGETLVGDDGSWSGYPSPVFTYQWYRCDLSGVSCSSIASAGSSSYQPVAEDVGSTLRLRVTATNAAGSSVSDSAPTSVVEPPPSPPSNVSLPNLSGSAVDGESLSVSTGSWSGDQPISFTYAWLRCDAVGQNCVVIPGENSSTYVLNPQDVGGKIKARVSAGNALGSSNAESLLSQAVAAAPVAPSVTSLPVLSGNAQVGQSLSASSGSWSGDEPITFSYQWLRCDSQGDNCAVIPGETSSSYALVLADLGSTIRARVNALNAAGSSQAESSASQLVEPADSPPVVTALPSISGSAALGSTLTALPGSWDGYPAPTFTYEWLRCDSQGDNCSVISGETSSSYTPSAPDTGHGLKVRVRAANSSGEQFATSASTDPVEAAPSNNTSPSLSGVYQVGEQVSLSEGSWAGYPAPTFGYAWLRCDSSGDNCSLISGETSSSYTLQVADRGSTIRGRVSAQNSLGSVSLDSAYSAPVAGAPENQSLPSLSGTAQVGQALVGAPGSWGGYPAPTFSYAWLRCDSSGDNCSLIAGETSASYTLSAGDLGATIRFRVSASNLISSVDAQSVASEVVSPPNAPPANTTPPSFTGTAKVGSLLSADLGSWSGVPSPSLLPQWQRCDSQGNNCQDIPEATSSSYTLAPADLGATLRLQVLAVNSSGAAIAVSSLSSAVEEADSVPVNLSLPSVSGTASLGELISGSTGSWGGYPAPTLSYAWLRCDSQGESCAAIPGATALAYTIASPDVGSTLRLRVTATNSSGSVDADSGATSLVYGSPQLISAPSLSGVEEAEQVLSALPGDWAAYPEETLDYQWQRCNSDGSGCSNIASATSSTYTLLVSDIGKRVRVKVTATNMFGSLSAFSAQSNVIADPSEPPVNTSLPVISGTPEAGSQLTATGGSWTGYPSPSFTYQWLTCDASGGNCSPMLGESSLSLALTITEIGSTIRFRVTAQNGVGSPVEVISAATALIQAAAEPPVNTSLPALSGVAKQGVQLSGDDGQWAGTLPLNLAYQWFACDADGSNCAALPGANGASYTPGAPEVGRRLRLRLTASNSAGSEIAESPLSDVVAETLPPLNTVAPSLQGTAKQGSQLTGDAGTWTGDQPINLSYQWISCAPDGSDCNPVSGATSLTLSLPSGLVGRKLKLRVSADNGVGVPVSADSALSGVVAALEPPTNTSLPEVTGQAKRSQTLTATDGQWSGEPTLLYTRAWQRCDAQGDNCQTIDGQTANSYQLGLSDVGKRIRFAVVVENGIGSPVLAVSSLTSLVANWDPPVNTALPQLSGTAKRGSQLTGSDGSWSGEGTISLSRVWQRCDLSGDNCVDIPEADGSQYTLSLDDVDHKIRLKVFADNGIGSPAFEVSAPTTAVLDLVAPVNQSAPSFSGVLKQGQALTGSPGTWDGDAPITKLYQWQRCQADGLSCVDIASATLSSYQLSVSDVGKRIKLQVTASNSAGSVVAESEASTAVASADAPAAPTITSSPGSSARSASFSFSGSSGAAFECSIDQAAFASCTSPYSPSGLSDGTHLFRVRQQVDGNWSVASEVSFRLDTTSPEPPSIISAPQAETPYLASQFEFTGEEGASFECRYDDEQFATCQSPVSRRLDKGRHSFSVRQVDAAGNTGAPAVHRWTITSGKSGNGSGDVALTPQLDDRVEASGGSSSSARIGCQVSGAEIESCEVDAYVYLTEKSLSKWGFRAASKRVRTVIGSGRALAKQGQGTLAVTVKFNARGKRLLERARGPRRVRFSLSVELKDALPLKSSKLARVVPRRQLVLPSGGMFHSGQSSPSQGGRRFIRELSGRLPGKLKSITCTGHTDSRGPASLNYRLGLRRAESVCAEIRRSGVKASYRSRSAGESKPRASNRWSKGRALNRRVEISLSYR